MKRYVMGTATRRGGLREERPACFEMAQVFGFYIAIPISESDDPSLLRYTMNPVGTTWISRPEFRLRDTRREIRYPIYRKLSGRREGEALMNLTSDFDVHKMMCRCAEVKR